jgi:aminoglycoside phosphotransferase (APT) family kinase protein
VEEGWELERPPRLELEASELSHLVEPAFPGRRVSRHAALMSGLANTNIRFQLEGDASWYVLRLHTRDRGAARRELDIARYLERDGEGRAVEGRARSRGDANPRVPMAPLIYSDPGPERGDHPYSIWGFVDGTLLQDLFERLPPSELVAIAAECGRVLAAIGTHPFARCGELGPDLEVVHEYGRPSHFVPNAIEQALFRGRAGARLGEPLRDELWRVVERTSPQLAVLDDRYALVHGDYKRSNLLVERGGTGWRVAAVLDWEFAFAGPPLVDIGLFLRAGAALPHGFREAFASAYAEAGGQLPTDWLPLSRLIDVLSQVTFLDGPRDRPRVFAECTQVVEETVRMLA